MHRDDWLPARWVLVARQPYQDVHTSIATTSWSSTVGTDSRTCLPSQLKGILESSLIFP